MLISGAHSIVYSINADADRAVLRDDCNLTRVDVGGRCPQSQRAADAAGKNETVTNA